jgi:dihydrofolate synthase/folylpolyglutamate synthase
MSASADAAAALERLAALHPKLIDLSLGRIARVLDALGRPQDRLGPVVHVAGTNGKGSTIAFLRAIAEAAGLRVHVYTSPHLVRFNERIRIAGALIDDARLTETLADVERANAGAPLTFFEATTAAAFHAFAQVPADLCLVEVGLGGRFDATNVIAQPALSVITPVDLDHMEFLGDTIGKIAGEKAGILKSGAPGVIARQHPDAMAVIDAQASRLGAPLQRCGEEWDVYLQNGRLIVQTEDRLFDLPPPALVGPHQIENAGAAVVAAAALGDARIDHDALAQGLTKARWPGRFQRLTEGPLAAKAAARGAELWVDGGHNPHGARAQVETLRTLAMRSPAPLRLIVGMLESKDRAGYFAAFRGVPDRVAAIPLQTSRSFVAPETLVAEALAHGLRAETASSLDAALDAVLSRDGPPPRILITGSLYLAGEALATEGAIT